MNYRKVTLSLIVFGAMLWGALGISIPWYIEAPLVVEPLDVKHVYTKLGGTLTRGMLVKPGEQVRQGQVLAILHDPEMVVEEVNLHAELALAKNEYDTQQAVDDQAQMEIAAERVKSLEKQLAKFLEHKQLLTIQAPCDGVVIAPPRAPEAKHDVTRTTLPHWFGTPMDSKNVGCTLEPKTQLCSIAPNDHFQAILMIDQADRNDASVGDKVRVKLDHMSHVTYLGTISEIADRHSEFCPPPLSNKNGGDLATVQDKEGRERLTSIAYQATVRLEQDARMLKNGVRGRARVTVDTRSVGQWIWRYILQTFHFRL